MPQRLAVVVSKTAFAKVACFLVLDNKRVWGIDHQVKGAIVTAQGLAIFGVVFDADGHT